MFINRVPINLEECNRHQKLITFGPPCRSRLDRMRKIHLEIHMLTLPEGGSRETSYRSQGGDPFLMAEDYQDAG